MPKALDRVGASMYVSEVRDLVDSLQYRIQQLEARRDQWLVHETAATQQVRSSVDDFSHELFAVALHGERQQQTAIFDMVEAMFTAWARLSLLLHPVGASGTVGKWREKRGEILRTLLDLPDNTLLSNRSFRDSWMHFDERLDVAYQDGWLGNRQKFVRTGDVAGAVGNTIRVIDAENLRFHFRNRDGHHECVGIAEMKKCLLDVQNGLDGVGKRIMTHLPAPA